MAQKHMSTARTESMLENSATDTSMLVMVTNMVAATTGRRLWNSADERDDNGPPTDGRSVREQTAIRGCGGATETPSGSV